MEPLYLLGEPVFDVHFKQKRFQAPIGQLKLCEEVLREDLSHEQLVNKLRGEYLAIAQSMMELGVNFRIIYAHEDKIDKTVLAICINILKCRLIGFSEDFFDPATTSPRDFGPATTFPRDFCTVLPNIVLSNPRAAQLAHDEKDGYALISSPFGEGGRVLHSGKTMLVCERVVGKEKQGRFVRAEELKELTELGIKVAKIPAPLGGVVDDKNRFFSNDHIDRVCALIADNGNNLHLIIDPLLFTTKWRPGKTPPWDPVNPKETVDKLRKICEPLEIEVHAPKSLRVPYSLNLMQFSSGQILMTAGDDGVAELVCDIVGVENVYITPTPIRYYPVWLYAGIRCLIADAPTPILKPA